ncbi:MAG: NADH:flavin oxidoreductase/NADH oxidase [Rhizobiales bacterium]|nr:NADH:flavin oxidoreductase/NADH oxidase [Hyphomicrobiales bacterium]
MTSALFSPLSLGPMTLHNRIAVAPMCQYSADDGAPTDWHLQHWMNLGMSQAGMITFEATGVERRGRISHGCLGLYSDAAEDGIAWRLKAARRVAPHETRFGVQLAHAGRKASSRRPWHGGGPLPADEDPWQTVAPSAIPFTPAWHTPVALDEPGIERTIDHFVAAARRAERAGFDFVELHFAHGYLVHTFLSPLANHRKDQWGGSLENRMRIAVAIARAVRAALPASMAMGARLSCTDWVEGGFNLDEAVKVAAALKHEGAVYICCSSGGVHPDGRPPAAPSYMVPFAERIRREAGIPTRAVGLIDDPMVAEAIVAEGRADVVALARAMLADMRWPWRAASLLGEPVHPVHQYALSAPVIRNWAPPPA